MMYSITGDDLLMTSRGNSKIVLLVTSAFGGIGGIETFNRALIGALDQLAARHKWNVSLTRSIFCSKLASHHAHAVSCTTSETPPALVSA